MGKKLTPQGLMASAALRALTRWALARDATLGGGGGEAWRTPAAPPPPPPQAASDLPTTLLPLDQEPPPLPLPAAAAPAPTPPTDALPPLPHLRSLLQEYADPSSELGRSLGPSVRCTALQCLMALHAALQGQGGAEGSAAQARAGAAFAVAVAREGRDWDGVYSVRSAIHCTACILFLCSLYFAYCTVYL